MNIEFSGQNTPKQFIEQFASKLGATLEKNAFVLPAEIGDGFMRQFNFFEGFSLTLLYFKTYSTIKFIRKASDYDNLFPIFFYNQDNELKQKVDLQNRKIGYHSANGIFMPSPQIETHWEIPANIQDYQLTITVSRNWLLSNIEKTKNSYLYNLLTNDKPFYLFETLTSEMMRIIKNIYDLIINDEQFLMTKLHYKTMELFALYLEKVELRELNTSLSKLNHKDIERIFNVRKQIIDSLPNKITIVQLAQQHNMSVRKLQQLFLQIFGENISQFALTEKMNRAKELLNTKQYSVSEIGYSLGYSNLSHFSKAFKKQFGINPKQYILKDLNVDD